MTLLLAQLLTVALATQAPEVVEQYEARQIKFTGGEYEDEVFEYRLLKPKQIDKGKKYPVVLFLHGAGERGSDNVKSLKYLPERMAQPQMQKAFPCFVIVPQCRSGKKWVDVDWSDPKSAKMPKEPSAQMQVVIKILKTIQQEFPTDNDRIYLTGLSMGGYGSWDLAARHPDWFAAVVPICGGGDEAQAKQFVDLPTWAFHGDKDKAVPVERSRKMIAAIREAGGEPKYTELPNVGHNVWTYAYSLRSGLLPWMFQQSRSK